ncbi:unnamed protein product, partial [Hapterophycus canaliculatus]
MFKARKKDVRRAIKSKTAEDASDDEAGNVSDASVGTAPPPPTTAAASTTAAAGDGQTRPKKMRKKIKAKAEKGAKPVLSFGHEDEEDSGIVVGKAAGKREDDGVFRVKKTKASKAMARAAKEKTEFPIAPQNDTARGSWHTATAGMYTKEGLAELRSSQAFTPKPSGGRSRERMTRGGVGKGEEDAGAAASDRVFAGDEAEMVHEAGQQGDLKEGLDNEDISRLKGKHEALLASREALGKGASGGGDGDDFIPLDGKVPVPGARKGSGGAGANGNGSGGAGQEDDEEQQRWEEEQVRRGATRPAAKPKTSLPTVSPWGGGTTLATANGRGVAGGVGGWGGMAAAAGERPRFLGINEMQKALREAGTQLRETHERNERQLQVVGDELETSSAAE